MLVAGSTSGGAGFLAGPANQAAIEQSWTRVDGRKQAAIVNGNLVIHPRDPGEQPAGWQNSGYRYLDSLPTSPARLTAVIEASIRAERSGKQSARRGNQAPRPALRPSDAACLLGKALSAAPVYCGPRLLCRPGHQATSIGCREEVIGDLVIQGGAPRCVGPVEAGGGPRWLSGRQDFGLGR